MTTWPERIAWFIYWFAQTFLSIVLVLLFIAFVVHILPPHVHP